MVSSIYIPTRRILYRTEINAIEYPTNGNISSKRQLNEIETASLHPTKRLKVNKDNLEFIYLKTRGSADRIRLLITYTKINCKITEYDYDQYIKTYKSILVPIPILSVNSGEYLLFHSNPIYQYLSTYSNLDGENEIERIKISNINNDCDFILHEFWKLEERYVDITISANKKEHEKSLFFRMFVLPFLNRIIDILKNKDYLIKDRITSADISVYSLFDTISKLFADRMCEYEKVNDFMSRVSMMDGIKDCNRY